MKTIGLLGGMSWESTLTYYKVINETIKERLGGLHSAKCILYSVDFEEIRQCQSSGDWQKSAEILKDAALALERAGADFVVICTNTMHKIIPDIQDQIGIPFIHIAEVTAEAIKQQRLNCVALLGTKYTMEQEFYKQVLIKHGIEVVIPEEKERQLIDDVIFGELCLGQIKPESKRAYLEIMERLQQAGAQGMILGCTEIGLLVTQEDIAVPVFDTALIHAQAVALAALAD
ncbi:aspartate/glutamate racemase family protein [Aerococcaceae bacterium NML210727]|nr:aspartate/glutamate racemase family protein [Aerococcaceae bacterium NML210727]MCW6653880.1 aspartate/glutamate racemase family protein [Aerococcaceae bacterium NML201296]MCW6661913.1 aspartate/glutamate racemase family protein [Aerococcaceae bacterium NML201209]